MIEINYSGNKFKIPILLLVLHILEAEGIKLLSGLQGILI